MDKDTFMYGDLSVPDEQTVSRERYEQLLDAEAWVGALAAAGVDSWEGFDRALEIYNAFNNKD